MRLSDYDTTVRFKATVESTTRITPETTTEVRELALDLDRPGFDADAGQSVGVLAPGQREFGQEHHFRLYTIADQPEHHDGDKVRVRICARRCSYVDRYSGERYKGVASHYLCDLKPGAEITMTGPYGLPFEIPVEPEANLILVGMGTGIAPFRAFLKRLASDEALFEGRVWLFHGARTGIDMLYRNDVVDDLSLYFDKSTFEAIEALATRPHWSEDIDWSGAMMSRSDELWKLLREPDTYVYLAGLESIREQLDAVFAKIAGGDDKWARRRAELVAGGRWVELLY
jgi:ferredoxin--NADP+ reductase